MKPVVRDARAAQDRRRLMRSALASLAAHAALLLALVIIAAAGGAPSEERIGMISINIESDLPRAPSGPKSDATPSPDPAPPVKPTPERRTPAPKKAAAVSGITKADKNIIAAEKTGDIREPVPAGKNEAPSAPPSRLDKGSLSRLDRALANARDDSTETAAGGGGEMKAGGGPRANADWEDRAARELLFQAAPAIPRWVSEQGLRLTVGLAVELNADGLVIVRGVAVSSGYPDVDAAVAGAVSRWKYSRGAGTRAVRGTITYYIELK
ncbi:MAG: hypothetical protein JXD23_11885 [Spirochaetales bacterium]|nr:hypothetical protein [Spirochaetales bacterium]